MLNQIEYLVIANTGAGEYWIREINVNDWWSNENPNGVTEQQICEPYGTILDRFDTLKEAEKYLEEYKKLNTDYCVIWDKIEDKLYIEELIEGTEQDLLSGYEMASIVLRTSSLEEAKEYCDNNKED